MRRLKLAELVARRMERRLTRHQCGGAGALVGLAAGPALAISLLKRTRDFALGLPAVFAWQAMEWSALRPHRKAEAGRAGRRGG